MTFIKTLLVAALVITASTSSLHAIASKDGKSHDYRTFMGNGEVKYGQIADSYTADLVMYLAGNQFMVMEDLVNNFKNNHHFGLLFISA